MTMANAVKGGEGRERDAAAQQVFDYCSPIFQTAWYEN